ncbi:MAG: FG-GAP-like repeat-containing protein, partial [Desulfobacterales bacterium]
MPPGRNGLAPELTLAYNSYQGNGWVGMGWDLNLGAIRRSTKFGIDYNKSDYVAELPGASKELVARGDWGANHYGAKIEGDFSQYYFNSATQGWEVYAKDGTIAYYGSSTASRQTSHRGIYQWCLDRIEDPSGNYLEVTYTKSQAQIYPARIDYTGHAGLAPSNYVQFNLEARPDVERSYAGGFAMTSAKRLAAIAIYAGDELAREYRLDYETGDSTARSRLSSVTECGQAGTCLPATDMVWTEGGDVVTVRDQAWGNPHPAGGNWDSDSHKVISGDFNGDGRDDIFLQAKNKNAAHYLYLAQADGRFTQKTQSWSDSSYTNKWWSTPYRHIVTGDFNGDGRTDLFLQALDHAWSNLVYLARADGTFSRSNPLQEWSGKYPNVGTWLNGGYWDAYYHVLVTGDYNGDGRTDLFLQATVNSNYYYLFLAGSDGKFTSVHQSWNGTHASGMGWNAQHRKITAGDFNGDGKSDIFLQAHTKDWYNALFHADANGKFTTLAQQFRYRFPEQGSWDLGGYWSTDYHKLIPGDYNGDGRTDLFLQAEPASSWNYLFLANGGGGFSQVHQSWGDQYHLGANWNTSSHKIASGDFNGDGRTDLFLQGVSSGNNNVLVLASAAGKFESLHQAWPQSYLGVAWDTHNHVAHTADFNGDGRSDIFLQAKASGNNNCLFHASSGQPFSDLLARVDNPLGGSVSIAYSPSTTYSNGLMPFVVQTVAQITTDDSLGNHSVTRYSYADGLYAHSDRSFRGFGYARQIHPDQTIRETWYHQGQYSKGLPYQVEQFAPGAQDPFALTTNTWEMAYIDPPANTSKFPKLNRERTEYYDAATVFRQTDFTWDETNGNLLTRVTSGTDGESVTTDYTWDNFDPTGWLWRKTQKSVTGDASGLVREAFYDYNLYGNLNREEFWLESGTNPVVTYAYDNYGNRVSKTDARGNTTTYEYDTATHTYPVKTTYPTTAGVAHVEQAPTWDHRFGRATRTVDENQNATLYAYDDFGRLTWVGYPDGGRKNIIYADAAFPRYIWTRIKAGDTEFIDGYLYFDGLGRKIQGAEPGENNKFIITQWEYDEMGRESMAKGPFFAANRGYPQTPPSQYPWKETQYDKRGRPTRIKSPHGEYGTIQALFSYRGFAVTATDPDGKQKTETRDHLGRIIQVTEHTGTGDQDTFYSYNAAGDLTEVTDALGNITTLAFDTLGRKIRIDDPDMGLWSYTYDRNGNLKTQTDAKQQTVTLSYDKLNRKTAKVFSTADPSVVYTYDNLTIPNGIGRLYAMNNTTAVTTYNGYDALGRVTSVTKSIQNAPDPSYTTQTSYDVAGRPSQVTYPDSAVLSYTYHPGTRLLAAASDGNSLVYAMLTDYAPTGKIGQVFFGNNTTTAYTYDPWSTKLTTIISEDPTGQPANDLQRRFYRYTKAGDIKEIQDDLNQVTYSYTYDDLHRLLTETNSGSHDPITLTYDETGNITTKTVGSTTMAYAYDPNHVHGVSNINRNGTNHAYSYDANGNLTAGPAFEPSGSVAQRTLSYNAANMPTQIDYIQGGATVTTTLGYDGDNTRVRKSVSGQGATFYIDENFEVIRSQATRYIFAGNLRIAQVKNGAVHY